MNPDAVVAQWIERLRPKEGVGGSSPSDGAIFCACRWSQSESIRKLFEPLILRP